MPLLLPLITLDVSEGAGSSMRLMLRTRSNFLITESVGDFPDSADLTTSVSYTHLTLPTKRSV